MKCNSCVNSVRRSGRPGRLGRSAYIGILFGLAGAIPAWAETPISTCGTTISTPGNYAITVDLTCAADGIDITASNVSLKLNGHVITGGPTHFGILVLAPSGRIDHVGIEGPGLIRGFNAGINMARVDYSQVDLVALALNGNGLAAFDVTFLTVASNVIGSNTNVGLNLISTNSVVSYNDLSGNRLGLLLSGDGNTVNNNTANGNRENGIQMNINGNGTRVYANVTNSNGWAGITIDQKLGGDTRNQIFSNTSSKANGTFDLEDGNFACGTNLWNNNVFFTRSQSCIH